MGVGDAIDGCVYISIAKCHVECDRVEGMRIDAGVRHNSRFICAIPGFNPGNLAGLTCLPIGGCCKVIRLENTTAAFSIGQGRAS